MTQRLQLFTIGGAIAAGQRKGQLLNGGDDDLVGVAGGKQTSHQCGRVGVLLHTAFLKAVEFLPGLAVKVLAVHHEETFCDVGIAFEQR